MPLKKHGTLLAYSAITWLAFYLVGLPDYYQSWPTNIMIVVCIALTLLYIPITTYSLKKIWQNQRHFTNSLWLSLYLTVPLFTYDYLLLALYKDLGMSFVISHWYLTIFYFSFWLQIPLIGWWLERKAP